MSIRSPGSTKAMEPRAAASRRTWPMARRTEDVPDAASPHTVVIPASGKMFYRARPPHRALIADRHASFFLSSFAPSSVEHSAYAAFAAAMASHGKRGESVRFSVFGMPTALRQRRNVPQPEVAAPAATPGNAP